MPKKNTRKVSIPSMSRVADVLPKTLDRKNRTVEIVFTKGAQVRRFDFFDGPYIEELGLNENEVRMERIQSGTTPFLDSHGHGGPHGIRNAMGVITSAELIPGVEGRAVVKFSKRAEVEEIFQDIEDGIFRNVSVGYNTHKIEKVGEENDVPIYRSTDWEPMEVSLVTIGADPKSQIRSDEAAKTECVVIEDELNTEENEQKTRTELETKNKKVDEPENLGNTQQVGEIRMTPEQIEQARKDAELKARNEAKAAVTAATAAEKARQLDIRSVVKKVGLGDDLAEQFIKDDKSIDEVRTLAIDALAEKDKAPETQTRAANEVHVGDDLARKGRIEGMTSALLHRFRPTDEVEQVGNRSINLKGHELAESGRQFAYFSFSDMARACLEANNIRTGMMSKQDIADRALQMRGLHSTADFPEILANVVNKTLRSGYEAAPITWKPFVNEVFVNDFKEISRTNLGDAAKLEKVGEGSESKRGTISEAAEKYNVEEYAKTLSISRKVIINDDLGFVTKLPERMGRRARDLESDLVWDEIKANAALADTFALFSAQHGNLSTVPAAPSEAGLGEARKLMRRQLGLDGAEISLTPVVMIVPPEHETAAEKLIASIVPDSSTNVSPFSAAGRTPLRLDVEPRIETGVNGSLTQWFIMASKAQVDMVELARLSGSNGPRTMTREGFDVAGMDIKITHDVGVKAIDFRGLFKNAGA